MVYSGYYVSGFQRLMKKSPRGEKTYLSG